MIKNNIIVFDFETGSNRKSDTEVIQVAAVALKSTNLQVVAEFESLMKPLDFDALQDETLSVNKKTREELAEAPEPGEVWHKFASWCRQWNLSRRTDMFASPVAAGHDILNFDWPIYERYCLKYGTTRTEKNGEVAPGIFNNIYKYDTLQMVLS